MKLTVDGHEYAVELTADGVTVDGQPFTVGVDGLGSTRIATVNGRAIRVDIGETGDDATAVLVEGQSFSVTLAGASRPRAAPRAAVRPAAGPPPSAIKGAVTAQMTGRIVRIAVEPGATVAQGDLLLVLEAMKMENEVRSPRAGAVKEIRVSAGDRVSQGDPLVVLDE